jgi:SAM-dependent methyltransferase
VSSGEGMAHRRDDEVLASGDAAAIKHLYVELGETWWGAHAGSLDDVPLMSLPDTHAVVAEMLAPTTGLVLDAGCGPNPAVACTLAADPDKRVIALDIGFGTVRLARSFAARSGLPLLAVVGDLEALPFREGVFDAVVSDDTIEHLPDDDAGVAGLLGVARLGAPVVLATPNRHNAVILKRRARDLLRGRRHPIAHYYLTNAHLREYTWPEFEKLVGAHAPLVRRMGVGWRSGRPSWKRRLASTLVDRGLGRRFGQMIVVQASGRGRLPA